MSELKSSKHQSQVRSQKKPKPEHDHHQKPSLNLPSLIERLPNEIIGHIFEEYVEMDKSPCVLASVSMKWNSLALTNPRLWVHIEILSRSPYYLQDWKTYPIIHTTKTISTRGKFQICESKEELEAAFSRAGSLNIHLLYRYTYDGHILAGVLNSALSSPLSSRICSLEMYEFGSTSYQGVDRLNMGSFPQLKHLVIEGGDGEPSPLLHDILLASPILQSLRVASHISDDPNLFPLWDRLRILDISAHYINSRTFDSIVNRCSHLIEFSTHEYLWPHPHTSIGPETLSSVRTAKFVCELPLLLNFKFRSLRSLDIWDTYHWRTIPSEVVRFDSVTFLRITLVRSSRSLQHLDMPRLKKLEIIKGDSFMDTNSDVLSSIAFPTLMHLSITANWKEKTFIDSLDGIPNIRSIEFILKASHTGPSWNQLLERLAGKGGHSACAKLESLILGSIVYPVNMRKGTLDRLVKNLNEYREKELVNRIRIELYNHSRTAVEVERLRYNE